MIWRRVGNVSFNYIHDNNFSEEEVTEDFICIICLKKCGNFKGLEFHLLSSHDLFSFDFKISEEKQAVYIRLKHHTRTDQLFPEAIDPRHGTFSYFSKYRKRGRLVTGTEMIVLPKTTEMIVLPKTTNMVNQAQLVEYAQADFENGHVQKNNDVSVAPDNSLHGGSLSPQKVLQFGKTRKRRVDQIDPRKRDLLQKRQIFHSHKVQRMSLEDVLADHDSEGEIDDDVVDLEEIKMLDTYSDITKDEKHIMHMWNSFVRTQRVIADSHMPWACKAFSEHHGPLLVQNPLLRRSWRLVMIKFWNHNLLDARTMDACNRLLDAMENKSIVPVVNAE